MLEMFELLAEEWRTDVAQQNRNHDREQTVNETQPNQPSLVRQSCFGASGEVMRDAVDFEDVLDRLSKGVNIIGAIPGRSTADDRD